MVSAKQMSRRCGNVPHSEGNNRFCDRLRRLSSVHWGWLKATTEPTLYSCSLVDDIYPLLRKRRRDQVVGKFCKTNLFLRYPRKFYARAPDTSTWHEFLKNSHRSLKINHWGGRTGRTRIPCRLLFWKMTGETWFPLLCRIVSIVRIWVLHPCYIENLADAQCFHCISS